MPTGPSANLVPSRPDPKDYCRDYGPESGAQDKSEAILGLESPSPNFAPQNRTTSGHSSRERVRTLTDVSPSACGRPERPSICTCLSGYLVGTWAGNPSIEVLSDCPLRLAEVGSQ